MGACCSSSATPDRLRRNIDAFQYHPLKEHRKSHSIPTNDDQNISNTTDEKVNEHKNPSLSVKSISFQSVGTKHFAKVQLTKSAEEQRKKIPHFVQNTSLPSLPPLDNDEHIQIVYEQTAKHQQTSANAPTLKNDISVEWQSYISNEHAYLLENIPYFSAMDTPKDSIVHTKHSKEQALIIQLKAWIQQYVLCILYTFDTYLYILSCICLNVQIWTACSG